MENNTGILIMNFVFVGPHITCSTINTFFKNNMNNINAITIDFSLLINELIELGVIPIERNYAIREFHNILGHVFRNGYFRKRKSISSAEAMDELINHLYSEEDDSFLYKAFFYSIPVFISNSSMLNYAFDDDSPVLIDKAVDLRMFKYIDENYNIDKILLVDENSKPTILEILSNMSVLGEVGYKSLCVDDILYCSDGPGYLYDELLENV